jgi:hypothetical protein
MPDEEAREEYVLLEDGLIHFGSWNSVGSSGWNYGQFEPGVLAAALKILKTLTWHQRADPVHVARHMTAAINHQGGRGVLVGNWSNDPDMQDPEVDHPEGARPPTSWQGSVEILTQWARTDRAVSYGQYLLFATMALNVSGCLKLISHES